MKARKHTVFIAVEAMLVLLIAFVGWYFLLPAFNLRNETMWIWSVAVIIIIAMAVTAYTHLLEEDVWSSRRDYHEEEVERLEKKIEIGKKVQSVLERSIIIVIALGIIGFVISFRIFHAVEYRNLADVESGSFTDDFPEADPTGSNIPFVSMEIAQNLGDRTIANVQGAEFYEVDDEYNLIEYKGDYYRISSLSYGGLFKYFSASNSGIPGYVLVNARTQKATFCTVEGGYYYSPSSLFDKNLMRHLRTQYPTTIFDVKSYFEIDEEGNPYWITPTITKTIGVFGGAKVESIIITDAVNGNSEVYTVENLPKWVDHAMLLSYLKEKATDYYEFVHGVFNFSNQDVKRLSKGYTSFVNEKGEVCFTMGLTPANAAKSNVGFILINSRTGKIKEYLVDGIQEETAQARVETLVQNYGYSATFPQVINVEGIPTYLMCLTGSDGLIQDVALASISTSSNATAYAQTLDEAINKYKTTLANSGAIKQEEPAESTTVEGAIQHIYTAEIDGTTFFFYLLEGDDNLYRASVSLNMRQVLLAEGDLIKLTYNQEGDVINVTSIELG
ncbi:MAG: hypothetical protein IKG56_01125 [Clostridia bacterium]|nr:hypothetical protein [Clostridia bacterium]